MQYYQQVTQSAVPLQWHGTLDNILITKHFSLRTFYTYTYTFENQYFTAETEAIDAVYIHQTADCKLFTMR